MNKLKQKFDYISLLKFCFPSMMMMFVLALYTTIDGLFISNYVANNGIGALNIIMPIITGILAISFMFSTGFNSIISQLMGEKKQQAANSLLSSVYLLALGIGLIFLLICLFFKDQILMLLGANNNLYYHANQYFSMIMFFIPFLFLQDFGQVFFITASRPIYSLLFTLIGGIVNGVLDYIFLVKMDLGMQGAALATGIGYLIPAIASICYFSFNKKENLAFGKPYFNIKQILKALYNGSSEFFSNISYAIVVILMNSVMMQFSGEIGINALSVILQIQNLQAALFIGYSIGVLPIISYKYGENNYQELMQIVKKSIIIIMILSLMIVIGSLIFKSNIIQAYLGNNQASYQLSIQGFNIYVWGFLIMGLNFFFSMMFTAIGDAKHSIEIALLRSLGCLGISILILPKILGINGLWLAVPLSEMITFLIALYLYYRYFYHKFNQ